ncbi:MAG: hypothetical protein IPI20_21160 [Rhodoferax sp.]|nr:hypothetical protein [Rhodoferax sp.]MBP5987653.1 hypothetical protein [Azonexus sp.]
MSTKSAGKPKINKHLLRDEIVRSVRITRYAVRHGQPDKNEPVMTTGKNLAFIDKGVSNWRFDMATPNLMTPSAHKPPLVSVRAHWYTAQAALEKGIDVVSGSSANVFGRMGTLLVPDGFRIPTILATPENVSYYGLRLIESGSDFSVISGKYETALMQYDYTSRYKDDFLMKKRGGGGIFLETHDFPHIHIPCSKACGGYIVIGKQIAAERFEFTAFTIPYGFALYTPSGTIHGDGTLVGEYALTVADSALASADTVLVYNRDTLAIAHDIVPDWNP